LGGVWGDRVRGGFSGVSGFFFAGGGRGRGREGKDTPADLPDIRRGGGCCELSYCWDMGAGKGLSDFSLRGEYGGKIKPQPVNESTIISE